MINLFHNILDTFTSASFRFWSSLCLGLWIAILATNLTIFLMMFFCVWYGIFYGAGVILELDNKEDEVDDSDK